MFNEFKSIIQQKIVIDTFLPIPAGKITDPDAKGLRAPSDYIYEPSGKKILSTLVPKHLNFQLWRILLESNAAEQGARMTAMENATTNADDLIRDLQLVIQQGPPGFDHEGAPGDRERGRSPHECRLIA